MHSFIVSIDVHLGIYKQVLCFSLCITHPIQHNLVLNLLGQINIYSLGFFKLFITWVIDNCLNEVGPKLS